MGFFQPSKKSSADRARMKMRRSLPMPRTSRNLPKLGLKRGMSPKQRQRVSLGAGPHCPRKPRRQ